MMHNIDAHDRHSTQRDIHTHRQKDIHREKNTAYIGKEIQTDREAYR